MRLVTKISFEQCVLSIIPALEDNYIFLLAWKNARALVIDPGDTQEVESTLHHDKLTLDSILITHHHQDHTNGLTSLKKNHQCLVYGPDDHRIKELDHTVQEGEFLQIGPMRIMVIATPGHTVPHISYYFVDAGLLFPGDCLFGAGCGRVFEGTYEEMFASLQKLTRLPPETKLLMPHEYTIKNLEFALSIEPKNQEIYQRLQKAQRLLQEGKPTIPSTIAEENATNPFLRCQDPLFRQEIGFSEFSPIEVFTKLRQMKDAF